MPIPLSGNIQDTPLSDILEELRRSKATGTLTVCSNGMEKSIYVKLGQIVFAASSDTGDRLGETLVKSCKLTRENLEHAVLLSKKSAGMKKLGSILVENGYLTPKDLFAGLKSQVKDIIFSLFLWSEGTYHFKEHLPPDVLQLQINIRELIAEIIQRIQQES